MTFWRFECSEYIRCYIAEFSKSALCYVLVNDSGIYKNQTIIDDCDMLINNTVFTQVCLTVPHCFFVCYDVL